MCISTHEKKLTYFGDPLCKKYIFLSHVVFNLTMEWTPHGCFGFTTKPYIMVENLQMIATTLVDSKFKARWLCWQLETTRSRNLACKDMFLGSYMFLPLVITKCT